jgi:hypothetical protein
MALPGMIPGRSGEAAAAPVAYTNPSTFSTVLTKSSPWDVGTLSFGPAAADRHIIVPVVLNGVSNIGLSGISIGGSAGQAIFNISDGRHAMGIFGRLIPAGTAGNVTLTFSSSVSFGLGAVLALTGLQSLTPVDTDDDVDIPGVSTSADIALATSAGGIILGALACEDDNGGYSWVNATEIIESFKTGIGGGSLAAALTSGAPVTVTASYGAGGHQLGGASLR